MSDLISRKMAIDAFEPEHDTDWYTPQIIEVLEALPPVQPTQSNAQPTQINTLDCVSRQEAIDEIDEWIKAFRENGHKESAADACLIQDGIIQLPSAQPEPIKINIEDFNKEDRERFKKEWENTPITVLPAQPQWKKGKWGADGECPFCGYLRQWDDDNFCANCGADMRGKNDG